MGDRVCANCGDPLRSEYAETYCSQECFREDRPFSGANNPNYRGGKEITACVICGEEFEYYPSEKEGLYCPECVQTESWQTPPSTSGPDHPRWKGGTEVRECSVCGEPVERYPSGFTGEVVLCSDTCRATWLSETFSGNGHPNWKGGGNEPYGTGWARVREQALVRDEYQCVVCGASREDLGRNPDVHHIVPVREFVEAADRSKQDAHTLDNVVTLCIGCHRRAEFGRIPADALREAAGIDGSS